MNLPFYFSNLVNFVLFQGSQGWIFSSHQVFPGFMSFFQWYLLNFLKFHDISRFSRCTLIFPGFPGRVGTLWKGGSQRQTTPRTPPPVETVTEADDTHPTGMHFVVSTSLVWDLSNNLIRCNNNSYYIIVCHILRKNPPPPPVWLRAGGTHPTGMHSWYYTLLQYS